MKDVFKDLKILFLIGVLATLTACSSSSSSETDEDIDLEDEIAMESDASLEEEGFGDEESGDVAMDEEEGFGDDEEGFGDDEEISEDGERDVASNEDKSGEDDFGDEEFSDEEFSDEDFSDEDFETAEGGEEGAGEEGDDDLFSEFGEEEEVAQQDPMDELEPLDEEAGIDEELAAVEEQTAESAEGQETPSEEFAEPVEEPVAEVSEPVEEFDAPPTAEVADAGMEQSWIPVKKIKTAPYRRNGRLQNAVYIGRPGDTVPLVSQKIYGDDRSEQLLQDNPHLVRGMDPGDKLYYNSPNRPNDESQIVTYYEDSGVPSQTYVTNEGDNIRTFSKELLGHEGAWKEVWATNPDVESKMVVQAGLNLKYWPDSAAPAAGGSMDLASNTPPPADMNAPPPPPPPGDFNAPPPPPPPGDFNAPPPPPPDMAANDIPPPPPPPDLDGGAAGTVGDIPPPPPPMPPEPEVPAPVKAKPNAGALSGMSKNDQNLVLMGGAIALFLIIGMIIRKKKAAKTFNQFEATQTQI